MLFKLPKFGRKQDKQQQQQPKLQSKSSEEDALSTCSSIETGRQSQVALRGPHHSNFEQDQFAVFEKEVAEIDQHDTHSIVSMCDNDHEVPTAAPPALATLSDPEEETQRRERRANYARRNIGAMRRNGAKSDGGEWTFKLYDLDNCVKENKKQDMSEVAKSIRKTLVSSLTPLLVETTSQLRNNSASSGNANSGPNSVHLHITMKPEVERSSPSPDACLVRVSAKISNEDRTAPPAPSKNLRKVDDVMIQSMPAELLDNRALMKRDRRLRRHRNHRNLCQLEENLRKSSAQSSSHPDLTISDYDETSPVYFQQEILKRNESRPHRSSKPSAKFIPHYPADVRCARVVSLAQPQRHFFNYEQDDLFSETSVVGTWDERASSIAKCLVWMSKLNDEQVTSSPSGKPRPFRQSRQTAKLAPVAEMASPVVGGGEALAEHPEKVRHHHHVHHHFVAQF